MLTDQNFKWAAGLIGCGVAAIKAVTQQEADGSGFFESGKIKIKFEGHIFHHFTGGQYDTSHPTLSYPAWTEKYTPDHAPDEYLRFNQAYALDAKAAMLATSWGMFQIMGENYSSCGYNSVEAFVSAQHISERVQLESFCTYVKTQGLAKYLVNMAQPGLALANAAGFALRYNGTGYKQNHYDVNIAAYFKKYSAADQ